MKILILGINYSPEPIGIGPYTTGMAEALVASGHDVSVVTAKPYYPYWKADPAFKGGGVRWSKENGVKVARCPIYVPSNPNGLRRLMHHATFALRALVPMFQLAWRERPQLIISIAPSLIATPIARLVAGICCAKTWIHIQDFEVEAAFATGLLPKEGFLARAAEKFEQVVLDVDRVSSISPQMCARLVEKGVPASRVLELRNWANIDQVVLLDGESPYRTEWRMDRPFVALYSGNIANKQGIEIIIDAARLLTDRTDIMFVVCGNGANKQNLIAAAHGLENIRFYDLQPIDRLSDMLGLATVHLLPQIAGAADLVLPSKMTNMLASGRPIVATAEVRTGLASEIEGCGLVVRPADSLAFAAAIVQLIDDPIARLALGAEARKRAEERWSRDQILMRFEQAVRDCVN